VGPTCDPLITDVGQLYRIQITYVNLPTATLLAGNSGGGVATRAVQSVAWGFARLTAADGQASAPGAPPGAREVRRALFTAPMLGLYLSSASPYLSSYLCCQVPNLSHPSSHLRPSRPAF